MTTVVKSDIRNAIVGLLQLCRPSDVSRLVVARIVLAIKRHAIRSLAHVSQKILKLSPAIADRYSSLLVVLEGGAASLKAPSDHIAPTAVRWGSATLRWSCVSMGLDVSSFHRFMIPHSKECYVS